LWKRRRWGWWLSLLVDIGLVATLAYSMVDDNDIDWEQVIPTIGIVVLVVMLLLPGVRKLYFRSPSQPAASSS